MPTSKKPARNAPKKSIRNAAVALPSAAFPEADRVDIGSRYGVAKLVDLANLVLSDMTSYAFAKFGFNDSWHAAMQSLLDQIEQQAESKQLAKDSALPTGEVLDKSLVDAKAWRRDAMTTISITPGLAGQAPSAGTGTSIAKLTQSIRALLPLVGDARAAAHGGGAAAKAAGQALLAKLKTAGDAHKTALAKLSPEARALNAEKGLLYEELKRVSRTARNVAPSVASGFAVSTHLRAHHAKRTSKSTPTAKASGTTPIA